MPRLPQQFDNINSRIVDDLRATLTEGCRISIAAATFSIYAYETLKKELETVDELRFIFTSPTFSKEGPERQKREFFIPKRGREQSLYGTEFEIKLRNQLTQKAIARECADWIRRKAKFKTNVTAAAMNPFLNVAQDGDTFTYLPFKEFTTSELGAQATSTLNPGAMGFGVTDATDIFLSQFNTLWRDQEHISDVTEAVIDGIETVYKENAPDFIYFITLYHIFREFLEDVSEDVLPNEATGFKQSRIWGMLYNFQRDAALAIINKLEKYNGCILADSVGLGKTFTALSVIKYYEGRNKSVLVLTPKKLYDNWATFKANYRNNPIATDRLRYDILLHTDLSRAKGMSNGIDLERINWGNYDLVVIDESHNFRNGGKITGDPDGGEGKENRYLKLMNQVMRDGVRTKVLMLSATPVNNRFLDLKNQLQLAYEGDSANINGLLDTESSIEEIFRQAQRAYNHWCDLAPEERTSQRLLSSLSFDFFKVLDAVTIARSRKHIARYYDTADIGRFPERLAPISRTPALTDLAKAQTVTFRDISEMLETLNLSIYTPSVYIQPSAKSRYAMKYEGRGAITVDGREKGMRKLMAINLLKRLESSVNSFRLTLDRILVLIDKSLAAIDKFKRGGSGAIDEPDGIGDFDSDDAETDPFVGRKMAINLADMDYLSWERDLKADREVLQLLLTMLVDITPEHDTKLQQLMDDIRHKAARPINGQNRKILVFTAFADTAEYLYRELAPRIKSELGLETAMVTGTVDGRWTLRRKDISFNAVLTLFSPRSKDREVLYPGCKDEIDILIATDCISEGQNLQDCDYLINYDIHWNPVRIIQRFGRIDRIGSQCERIQLVNYWPDVALDEYISLKGRVESRMKATILTATGDDNLLSADEQGDLEYRRQQLRRLQEAVVDIEDMDTGVNIMDLGLNEFRMDLLAYVKDHPEVENVPTGMHAVAATDGDIDPGVIFVLKNRNPEVNINHTNQLHPFYMVYISMDGEVLIDHLSPKKLLDTMRLLCRGKTEPLRDLCRRINAETQDGRDMSFYSALLQDAISSIITVKAESDIESLFSEGETSFLRNDIDGLDDFELITFLIITSPPTP
ncbi:MAG: SNF2-related protein [Bacteroidales bacterium]|nr:SNF2-related protein [Bacteroidales bacterium]